MRILALDTATPASTVALLDSASGRAESARDDPPAGARPRHSAQLLRLVEEVLARAGLAPDALDRVAVGLGPGTFTGLRIGIATARGLARAAGAELVGVPTLTALGLGSGATPVLALLDARRGELFAAGWRAGSGPLSDAPAIGPTVLAPDDLPRLVAELSAGASSGATHVLAVGDGAIQFREVLRAAGAVVPPDGASEHMVDALQHAHLAALARLPAAPEDVRPLYLRRPDARPSP